MSDSSPSLDALRLFVKVAELGNLSHAAAVIGTTQPSVSRALRALEDSLQGTLFHRTGRGVKLTAVGEQTLLRARALLAHADQFSADIRDQTRTPTGTVTVALLTMYMRMLAADLFEEVHRRFPRIVLRLLESFSVEHEDWLSNGWVDIALVTRYRKTGLDKQDVLAASDVMVVGNPDLGGDGDELPFRTLASIPLVLPASPNGLRLCVDEEARRRGFRALEPALGAAAAIRCVFRGAPRHQPQAAPQRDDEDHDPPPAQPRVARSRADPASPGPRGPRVVAFGPGKALAAVRVRQPLLSRARPRGLELSVGGCDG
jgi:DNA-binding transcriptional LysR family regulator